MKSADNMLLNLKNDLLNTTNFVQLGEVEVRYLGRNGQVNDLMKKLKDLSVIERSEQGKKLNQLKANVETLINEKRKELTHKEDFEKKIDITLPGVKIPKGSLHLVSYAIEEIEKIFKKLGFIRMSYPEVEWEYFSFEALNMPSNHPARDDFETFFIDSPKDKNFGRMVLTPHTSSGQIREMLRVKEPPIRMINIGKTYRPNWDASHVPMFHQFEGLCIDENINITHLKGTIDFFAKEFFGSDREIRLRPFHFQFTEPSFEVDITCDICKGQGMVGDKKCRLCKQGWLELGGTGMVHPNVLKSGGIDSQRYTGWAFGFGVERVMMMKPGIGVSNMRVLYDSDIRINEQF